jgi:hypothetical protein
MEGVNTCNIYNNTRYPESVVEPVEWCGELTQVVAK